MKQVFRLDNVKCNGCANSLKKALKEEFGEVEINLDVLPREITVDILDEKIEILKVKCKSLGYPFADENLSTIDQLSTKAKSFVSCAIGKMEK